MNSGSTCELNAAETLQLQEYQVGPFGPNRPALSNLGYSLNTDPVNLDPDSKVRSS